MLDATFAHDPSGERKALAEERDRLTREIENVTEAIAAGGDIPALAAALGERDRRLKTITAQLARPVVIPDREALKAALELRTADWRNILRGPHIHQARMVLQHLIDLPIKALTETPTPKYIDAPGVLWGDPRDYQQKGKGATHDLWGLLRDDRIGGTHAAPHRDDPGAPTRQWRRPPSGFRIGCRNLSQRPWL